MSTLRSLSFGVSNGVDVLPEEVSLLFKEMATDGKSPVECADEIIRAGLEGRINLNVPFNLRGYEYTIKCTERMKKEQNKFKTLYIDFENDKENTQRGSGLYNADYVSQNCINKMHDAYEEIADSAELQSAIATIKSLNSDFIIEYDVDLVSLIKRAVGGFPEAREKLANVCKEFELVGEQVKLILSSGFEVETLLV